MWKSLLDQFYCEANSMHILLMFWKFYIQFFHLPTLTGATKLGFSISYDAVVGEYYVEFMLLFVNVIFGFAENPDYLKGEM